MGCPDDSVLAQRLAGQLDPDRAAAIDRHVDSCSTCYALMVELAALGTSVGEDRRTDDALRPGDRLGRYTVLELLGAGGMGSVYAAHDPELDRAVAIKVLHTGDSGRLIREAQAAARLRHEHVVPVYDFGVAEGRVFVVMELVRGQGLDAWLRQEPRSQAEILDLFIAASRGLAAAHEAGVVHRDVKPANILVGDDGRARLTDFGLAAAPLDTEPPAGEVTLDGLTKTGAIVGTPRYMSPEQFRGETADARSDQFSLCVAMYEALFGEAPFDGSSFEALATNVCAGRVRPAGAGAASAVRRVLLRGLAVEASDRFPSVPALVAALHRARRRRRRWPQVATGIVAGLAATWMLVPTGGARSRACAQGADRLAAVWNDARRNELRARAGRATETSTWVRAEASLDGWAERWIETWDDACDDELAPGAYAAVRSCLQYRRQRFDKSLASLLADDELAARDVLTAWGQLPGPGRCGSNPTLGVALPVLDESRQEEFDGRSADVETVIRLTDRGRLDEALAKAEEVYAVAQRMEHAQLSASAALAFGYACKRAGRTACSRERLSEAFFIARETMADDLALDAALQLVYVESDIGEGADAQTWIAHSQALVDVAATPVGRAKLLGAIGSDHYQHGRYEEAARVFGEASQAFALVLGEDHPWSTGALENRATMLRSLGRPEEALSVYRKTTALHREIFGRDHPTTLVSLNNLGGLLDELGDSPESARVLEDALEGARATYGDRHPEVGGILTNLGLALAKLDRLDEARTRLEAALAIFEARPPSAAERAEALLALGNVALLADKPAEAKSHYERALVIAHEHLDPDHPYIAELTASLKAL